MKSLTKMLLESYFHKFQFSYCYKSFHVKCRPTVTLQSIGGFGLNLLNLIPLIQNPGSTTVTVPSKVQASDGQCWVLLREIS